MAEITTKKRRIVVSFNNLSPEMQDDVRRAFPLGFTESMMRIDKPDGTFFYAVVYETEDCSYLVRIDVTIDGQAEDDEEKGYEDEDDINGADDIADADDDDDD